MTFRDAALDDLSKIVEIYNSTVASRLVTADLEPVSVESKIDWFHQHNSEFRPLWMVLDSEKNTVGWVSFQDFYGRPAYQKTAEISIYIDEKYRGKGLGRLILEYAIFPTTVRPMMENASVILFSVPLCSSLKIACFPCL